MMGRENASPIRGPERDELAERIRKMASYGRIDVDIAGTLGLTPKQVRNIRIEYGIRAGGKQRAA